eukprot:359823-Chlamydomonas_euryale.AAC.1
MRWSEAGWGRGDALERRGVRPEVGEERCGVRRALGRWRRRQRQPADAHRERERVCERRDPRRVHTEHAGGGAGAGRGRAERDRRGGVEQSVQGGAVGAGEGGTACGGVRRHV